MNNPFKVGEEVTGESFIGRKEWLKFFFESIYKSKEKSGSISLTGIPRVGKSSLIYNVRNTPTNLGRDIYSVEVIMGKCTDFNSFWITILWAIYDVLDEEDVLSEGERKILKPFLDEETIPPIKFRRQIEKFFTSISRKCKLVIYIDEFDFAEKVFGNNSSHFQFLRELVSDSNYSMSFVVVSRRSLMHIETSSFGGSNLNGVFQKVSLKGFDNEELKEYFDKINGAGITLSEEIKSIILYLAGRSPYLLSTLGRAIVEDQGRHTINEIYEKCSQQFLEYYKNILSLLKDEEYYLKLIQLYIGPKYDLKKTELDELVARGYITEERNASYGSIDHDNDYDSQMTRYETISEHFIDYLRIVTEVDVDQIWTILSETEKKIRLIIEKEMKKEYGVRWMDELRRIAEECRKINRRFIDFHKADNYIESNRRRFGVRANDNILNVISIHELTNIMEYHWQKNFSKYFNNELFSKWIYKFNVIAKARNPLAHNFAEYLTEEEIKVTEAYCNEVTKSIVQSLSIKMK